MMYCTNPEKFGILRIIARLIPVLKRTIRYIMNVKMWNSPCEIELLIYFNVLASNKYQFTSLPRIELC